MRARLAVVPEQRLSKSSSPLARLKHIRPGNQPFKVLPSAANYDKPRELSKLPPETVAKFEPIALKIIAVQMWHVSNASALS